MLRNVASQKWRVYAWDTTTGQAKTGDAANIAGYITVDDGTPAATNDAAPTEVDATNEPGYYDFGLTQAETNGAKLSLSPKSGTSNIQVVACPPVVYTRPQYFSLLGIASDGDLTKVNSLHGHTPQTADHTASIASTLEDTNELQGNQGNWATATGFSTHSAADVWSVATRVLTANTNLNDPTTAAIADAILGRDASGSTTNSTLGAIVNDLEDGGRLDLLVDAMKAVTDALTAAAASKLAISAGTIVTGTVSTATTSPTTTVFAADDITEATADHFNGRIIIFTSGALANQATDITDYALDTGEGKFTVTALTESPSNDDTFVIV